jgi:hypothetical protein
VEEKYFIQQKNDEIFILCFFRSRPLKIYGFLLFKILKDKILLFKCSELFSNISYPNKILIKISPTYHIFSKRTTMFGGAKNEQYFVSKANNIVCQWVVILHGGVYPCHQT